MSIATKALLPLVILIALLTAVAGFNGWTARAVFTQYQTLLDGDARAAREAPRANQRVIDAIGVVWQAIAEADPKGARASIGEVATKAAEYDDMVRGTIAVAPNFAPALEAARTKGVTAFSTLKGILGQVESGDAAGAAAAMREAGEPAAYGARDALREVTNQLSREMETSGADAQASANRATLLAAAAWLLSCVLALAAGVMVARRGIVLPLMATRDVMERLASGRLEVAVPGRDRTDEVGAMARAVQVFKDNALEMRRLEEQDKASTAAQLARARAMVAIVEEVGAVVDGISRGSFAARVRAETDDDNLRRLIGGINSIADTIEDVVSTFSDVLVGLSRGDLTRTINRAYDGRFGDLQRAINETVTKLAETVATIQATATDVSGAAREINAGADDLSRRTEQQASSLEETAATTEQLAASVKAAAASSRQAVDTAEQARKVAEDGGAIAGRAVEAMERIEQASRKISAIISVIDDIAFQTNLLALNAAVEAARAGEAGKGFAVVASEVRTLAQRSSEAAKDITALINTSTSEVEQGVDLVRSAGESLKAIVQTSGRVAATVAEISAATAEQANGIDEMSQAVAHMDEMTQQNAALAEESAASASSLTGQIERLNELVATFRTRQSQARAAPPAVTAAPMRLAASRR